MRNLARNLRPLQLEQLGLTDSIRDLVDRVVQSTEIRIEAHIEALDDALDPDAAMHLYRIVQEALNNLIKHSGATQASVNVERDIQCVRFRLADNGAGFEPGQPATSGGFGLTSIAERSALLRGSFKIRSEPGSASTLTVELPISASAAGGD